MIAPIVQLVIDRHAADGGDGGAGPDARDSERAARRTPSRTRELMLGHDCVAMCSLTMWSSSTRRTSRCCTAISFDAKPGTVTALVGSCGLGQVDDHQPDLRRSIRRQQGAVLVDGSTWRRCKLSSYREPAGRGAAGDVSVRRDDPRECAVFAARGDGGAVDEGLPDCAGG